MNSMSHVLEDGEEKVSPQTTERFEDRYQEELQFARHLREETQQMTAGLAAKLVGARRLLELVPPSFSGVVKAYTASGIALDGFLFLILHRKRFSTFLTELCELEDKQCGSLEEKIRILDGQFESEHLYAAVIGEVRQAELISTYGQALQAHKNYRAILKESLEFFYPQTQFPKEGGGKKA